MVVMEKFTWYSKHTPSKEFAWRLTRRKEWIMVAFEAKVWSWARFGRARPGPGVSGSTGVELGLPVCDTLLGSNQRKEIFNGIVQIISVHRHQKNPAPLDFLSPSRSRFD